MFQLIQQDTTFENRKQKWKEEVSYSAGLRGQFGDEKAMYEADIPTDTDKLGPDQYDSEDSPDGIYWPSQRGKFGYFTKRLLSRYGEYKELLQCAQEAMHANSH